ncbi:MAG: MFS transporter [Pseudomonadota bacterium]
MNYWQLLKQYPAFLMFGFMATFASSFGQTFFISLFVDDITELHNLSYGQFGSLYAITTAVGGLFLMRVGKKLDYIPLKQFAHFVVLGLALSAGLMALSANWLVLIVALFGLRLFGQGLMGHMAVTSMGRYFNELRGRAVAFSGIGFPAGEIVLPSIALFLLSQLGFINTWWLITALVLVVFWPLLVSLQAHHPKVSLAKTNEPHAKDEPPAMLRQRDIIRDKHFLGVLPAMLALPFVMTGILINQLWFAEQRSWSLDVIAIGIAMFSVSRVITSIAAGSWVDKLGSFKLIGVNVLPVAIGLIILTFVDAFWGWYAFMLLGGFSAGFNSAISGTLWPEIYGTRSLGTIRALYHSLMIFSTAAAPMLFGYLIDLGVPLSWWLLTTVAALVLAWLSARLAVGGLSQKAAK